MTRAAGLGVLVLLAACSSMREQLAQPGAEPPPDGSTSYLNKGPRAQVDLGGGEESLLTRFKAVADENAGLRQREQGLTVELETLRVSLRQAQDDLERERKLRAGADAEAERLRRVKSDHELAILHLRMQAADLQRGKLQLEIAAIQRELEAVGPGTAQPEATPPVPGK